MFGGTVLAAVAAGLTRRPTWARFARWTGLTSLGIGLVGVVVGTALTLNAMSGPGLSQSDRQRVFSNMIAEIIYNLVITGIAAAPALAVSWWVLRKRSTSL